MARTMRAALLQRFNALDSIKLTLDAPVPVCKPNEVLVEVAAASVNPVDCRIRDGYAQSVFGPHLPIVLGRDFSGRVAACGPAAREFRPGQEVFGAISALSLRGAFAEYVAIDQDDLCLKPKSLSHEEAAAIPFAALTAWEAVRRVGRAEKGQRLLVLGGGSAVGGAAVQLARAWGLEVAATAGERSADRVRAMGAEVASSSEKLSEEAKRLNWDPFDLVFDTVGGEGLQNSAARLLRKGRGHLVTVHGGMVRNLDSHGLVAGAVAAAAELKARQLWLRANRDVGFSWAVMNTDGDALAQIGRLASAGQLHMPIARVLPFENIEEAFAHVGSGAGGGKVVLTMKGVGAGDDAERGVR